jgi:hypothetical protein
MSDTAAKATKAQLPAALQIRKLDFFYGDF